MIKKTHTRNQKRMYRIHKQEEQIEKDKIIIAEQQIELDKYKEILDKIKEDLLFIKKSIQQEKDMSTDSRTRREMTTCIKIINELLEEIE